MLYHGRRPQDHRLELLRSVVGLAKSIVGLHGSDILPTTVGGSSLGVWIVEGCLRELLSNLGYLWAAREHCRGT